MNRYPFLIMLITISLITLSLFACSSSDSESDSTIPETKSESTVESMLNAVMAGEDYSQYVEANAAPMSTLYFSKDTLQNYTIMNIIKILDSKIVTVQMVFEKEGPSVFTFTVKSGKVTDIK